jgi:hypothetical protein
MTDARSHARHVDGRDALDADVPAYRYNPMAGTRWMELIFSPLRSTL